MKNKVALTALAVIGMLVGIVLFFISFSQSFSSAELTLIDNLNGLCLIYILRCILACFVLLGVLCLVYIVILKIKKCQSNSRIVISIIMVFVALSIVSIVLPSVNYSSDTQVGENVVVKYKDMFPYYDSMKNRADDSFYLTFERDEIFSTKYLELQNFCDEGDTTVIYDVKCCKSKNKLIFWQFVAENSMLTGHEISDEGKFNDTPYKVYQDDDSSLVIMSSDEAYCVFYLCNIKETQQDNWINDIFNVYENILQVLL